MLLEKIRIEKNIKIKDLAAKLNIDSSLMSRILSNKRKPSIAQLKILSDFLEIDFNEIMKEYLADEVLGVLKDYPQIAREVLTVAEERIQYLSGNDRFKTIALSKQLMSRLKILDELSKKWKNIKPLNEIQLRKMEEYFFTSYTYESNRIEGNTLTLQETHLVINEGITIGGKSMREHLELVNHKEAIELILELYTTQFKGISVCNPCVPPLRLISTCILETIEHALAIATDDLIAFSHFSPFIDPDASILKCT
jgi:transcriptional regulator with XRE-family HTH domain